MSLNTVQEIERAIGALSPRELEELYAWLDQHGPQPVTKAVDASPGVEALRRKNFVELCDPVRGLAEDIDFSRNPSTSRPLDL